jgi:type IV pilus assembly protein PilV
MNNLNEALLFQPGLPARSKMRGVGMIEVMFAVLLLGIGMMGIASMQSRVLRSSQGSMRRTQAVAESNAILDAMRANLAVARNNGYNMSMASAPCAPPAAGDLSANDRNWWIKSMQSAIGPDTCGSVSCAANICTIVVKWPDNRSSSGDSLTTVARL